ncbi:TPA: hypothetical protein ACIRVE_005378 [Pseudomonas putida]
MAINFLSYPQGTINVQHPFDPTHTIGIEPLLDLIAGELEYLDFVFDDVRHGADLLNKVTKAMTNLVDKELLVSAICARFIGS